LSLFDVVRELDDIVDLSRGRLQIEIIFRLGKSVDPVSVDELVRALGERRKAVFDSIRKLESKNIVAREGEKVHLTESGRRVFSTIEFLRKSDANFFVAKTRPTLTKYDEARLMLADVYLYETLQALNSSVKGVLSIETLSKIVGISPTVLDEHLMKFSKGELAFLYRHVRPRQIFGLKKTIIQYSLTDEGRKLVNLYFGSIAIRRRWSFKLLSKLVGTTHPRLILKRLALLLSIGSALAMLLQISLPTLSVLVLSAWVWLVSFFALLIENTY